MSPLPQRKKSAEEIAKLRETLGVPSDSAAPGTTPPGVAPSAAAPAAPQTPAPPPPPATSPAAPAPRTSEPLSLLPLDAAPVRPTTSGSDALPQKMIFSTFEAGQAAPAATTTAEPPRQKVVRSLKKSEQGPVTVPRLSPARNDSALPARRRSAEEIEQMRKREAMALLNAPPNKKLLPAHPLCITPGYLCAAGAASWLVIKDVQLAITAGCASAALLISLTLFILRPVSRHHAGFIAAITLVIGVFGALHYFDHLHHAT